MMFHDASCHFRIFINELRNRISENKLFANELAGSNNDHAKLFLVSAEWIVCLSLAHRFTLSVNRTRENELWNCFVIFHNSR